MSERQVRESIWEDECPGSPYFKGSVSPFEMDLSDQQWVELYMDFGHYVDLKLFDDIPDELKQKVVEHNKTVNK